MCVKQKIYIFGAHSRAQTLAVYLQYLNANLEVEAFLYDNEELNCEWIGEIPVICLDKKRKLHVEYPVYIGTRGIYHEKLIRMLEEIGFKKIYPVTVELDMQLRNAYLEKYFASIGREFIKLEQLKDGTSSERGNDWRLSKGEVSARSCLRGKIYVVKSGLDQPLQQEYQLAPYEEPIQAGASLMNGRLSGGILTDDRGENISAKNKQYCELTALYWIWKHAKEDVIGLAHYRRHFILPANWIERMMDNGVDVVLPVPLYVLPDIAENYKERHDAKDWEYMMQYLKGRSQILYEEAESFFRGNLYLPCNMFIMRREILGEFCEWMFPILDAVAMHGGEKEDNYLNRYPGFLAERLMTFYFEKSKERYKVVYADKNFLR